MPGSSTQNGSNQTAPRDAHGRTPPTEPASESIELERRIQLIERLNQQALHEPSPLAANLLVSGGDLLEMSLLLKPQMMTQLRSCASPADRGELQPMLDTYLKLNRQADRMLRLSHDIAQADSGQTRRRGSKTTAEANISHLVTHSEGSTRRD